MDSDKSGGRRFADAKAAGGASLSRKRRRRSDGQRQMRRISQKVGAKIAPTQKGVDI
jgi:hypothetical protein